MTDKRISNLILIAVVLMMTGGISAKPKECFDCHTDQKKQYGANKYVHDPVKKGECLACHDSHGFSQKLVLKAYDNALCSGCHSAFAEGYPDSSSVSIHPPAEKGVCWICHDPHGSNNPDLVRTVDNKLVCYACHVDIGELRSKEVQHKPFAEENCAACHVPHQGKVKGLLTKDVNSLCRDCHKISDKEYQASHSAAGVDKLTCDTCHDPHASDGAGLISPTAHAPLADGDCESCHTDPSKNGELTASPLELCTTCHDDIAAKLQMKSNHPPAVDGECLGCHSGHNSGRRFMLLTDENQICFECHSDFKDMGKQRGVHSAVMRGQCTSCHDSHGSPNQSLVLSTDDDLCLNCHKDKKEEIETATVPHPALEEMKCLGCHKPHISDDPPLLVDKERLICLQCHDNIEQETKAADVHPPFLTGQCGMCHNPHGSSKPGMFRADVKTVCVRCHVSVRQSLAEPSTHAPAEDGECLTCHKPHSSEKAKLLVDDQDKLCGECHGDLDGKLAVEHLHTPVKDDNCTGCHNPHGAKYPRMLPAVEKDLCLTCHTEKSEELKKAVVHKPVKEGDCSTCHQPHGSNYRDNLVEAVPELCVQCHDTSIERVVNAHGGNVLRDSKCNSCHNPHASDLPKLINSVQHAPFADKSCDACHIDLGSPGPVKLVAKGNQLCAECHDIVDIIKSQKHIHAPIETGDGCLSCHDPHATRNALMLKDNVPDLCYDCHGDKKALFTATTAHEPVQNGECLSCHEKHAGERANLLKVTRGKLCYSCHTEEQKRFTSQLAHRPVATGDCYKCHDAHGTESANMLVKPENELCRTCHSVSTASFKNAHFGFPMDNVECAKCHDPHSVPKTSSKLIYPDQHEPFKDRICMACHVDKTSVKTKKEGRALCMECHSKSSSLFDRRIVHEALQMEGECLNCHTPHAGFTSNYLNKPDVKVCFTCHDKGLFEKKFPHQPAAENCSICHEVHSSDNFKLLNKANEMDLCLQCHDADKTHLHPMGKDVKDPRTGTTLVCTSCHSPHSSDYENILYGAKERGLCVLCHAI